MKNNKNLFCVVVLCAVMSLRANLFDILESCPHDQGQRVLHAWTNTAECTEEERLQSFMDRLSSDDILVGQAFEQNINEIKHALKELIALQERVAAQCTILGVFVERHAAEEQKEAIAIDLMNFVQK